MAYEAGQIRVICSYCGVIIREAQDQTGDVVTSHGACRECAGIRYASQGGNASEEKE